MMSEPQFLVGSVPTTTGTTLRYPLNEASDEVIDSVRDVPGQRTRNLEGGKDKTIQAALSLTNFSSSRPMFTADMIMDRPQDTTIGF